MKRTSAVLLCSVATLLGLGAVMVFSVISARATTLNIGASYLLKHCLWITIGAICLLILRRVDYHRFERYRWLIIGIALLLLAAVLVPGIGVLKNNARRWIRFGPVGFQPSEFAKLAIILGVSAMAARFGDRMRDLRRGVLPCLAIVGVAAGLVIRETDVGTAGLIAALGALIILGAGAPLGPIAAAGVIGLMGIALAILRSPNRLERVFAFLDPMAHQDAAGYQLVHSLIALGSGGLFGRGLGAGRRKLFYLPEPDTDFIFSVIGEELGFVGALAVIVLFVLIIRSAMRISRCAPDAFGALVAYGIGCMIALQALIHVAVVSGSMPTKGIALPFVSCGGSSLVVSLASIGILLNIASQSRPLRYSATASAGDRRTQHETQSPESISSASGG